MRKPRPNEEVIAILEGLLVEARVGKLPDIFVLSRDGEGEYACDYWTGDLPDLLYELGNVILRERADGTTPSRN